MKRMLHWPVFRPHNIIMVAVSVVLGILFLCGSYVRVFENGELNTLDMRFRLRPSIPVTDKIAIVEIGDDTIQKLGRFPLDRRYHALLVKALSEYGARAVLFDVFFSEPDKNDQEFDGAIQKANNVYLPYVFDLRNSEKPGLLQAKGYEAKSLEYFQKSAAGAGHINVIPDSDGKYRRVPLLIQYNGALHPYLSFHLISDYLGVEAKDIHVKPGQYIQWGPKVRIPLDEQSNMIVNYAGPWGKYYQHYSYVDILRSYASLQSKEKPLLDLNVFRNKICVVGLTATGTTDLHPNPFSSLYPALSIHADLMNSILNNQFIHRASRKVNLVILFLLGALIVWGVVTTKPFKAFLIFTGVFFVFGLTGFLLFALGGLWIDVFYPLLALAGIYLTAALMMSVRQWKKKLFLDNELQIAKTIQQSFLPKSVPVISGLDVAALLHSARDVGGDLYDFYAFDRNRLGVMIGDVSGKGIPASLFMTTVSGLFKFLAIPETLPQDALHSLNVKLTQTSSNNLFVTMFYAIFDMNQRVMSYANGGHPPVMYFSKKDPVRFLDVEDGYPLGVLEGSYSGNQVQFSVGDVFVFFTDGVTEARDLKTKMYGNERFASVVDKNRDASAKDLLAAIETDVRTFEPEYKQSDDITCIVLKIT
ncbi:MAG: CHASE2 domain-containing protein [Candidatus Omnitrophica bacterium]|nr:CHASE2 domain-containing protein [Candidatus Omnitrophota bacterium]